LLILRCKECLKIWKTFWSKHHCGPAIQKHVVMNVKMVIFFTFVSTGSLQTNGRLLWTWQWTSWFHIRQGISLPPMRPSVCNKKLKSMVLI
jgi:hypothetical protein